MYSRQSFSCIRRKGDVRRERRKKNIHLNELVMAHQILLKSSRSSYFLSNFPAWKMKFIIVSYLLQYFESCSGDHLVASPITNCWAQPKRSIAALCYRVSPIYYLLFSSSPWSWKLSSSVREHIQLPIYIYPMSRSPAAQTRPADDIQLSFLAVLPLCKL